MDFEVKYEILKDTMKPFDNDFFNNFIAFQEAAYSDTIVKVSGSTEKEKRNSRNMYWNNQNYRKNKKLQSAYKRYNNGAKVCKRIIDDLKNAGYNDVEYRTDF